MTYVFYWKKVSEVQRLMVLLVTAMFLFGLSVENFLFLHNHILATVLFLTCVIVGGMTLRYRTSFKLVSHESLPPWPDIAALVGILLGVVAVPVRFALGLSELKIPVGPVTGRLDLDLFGMSVIALVIAISFPAYNDPKFYRVENRVMRPIMYLPLLGEDARRCWTGVANLFAFGLAMFVVLALATDVWSSMIVLAIVALLAPFVLEYAYGQQTLIMQVFGRTLIIACVFAILFQVVPQEFNSSETTHLDRWFKIFAAIWAASVLLVYRAIWTMNDTNHLTPAQKTFHSIYLGVLFLAHVFIYGEWIQPYTTGLFS